MEQGDESCIAQFADAAVDRLDARADIVGDLLAARAQDEALGRRELHSLDEVLL